MEEVGERVGIDATQLLKGVLDLAVLSVLEDAPNYGYAIVTALREAGHDTVGEASVYGTLRRLARAGALSTVVEPSESGPHRKYYALNADGVERLHEATKSWRRFAETMNYMLEPT